MNTQFSDDNLHQKKTFLANQQISNEFDGITADIRAGRDVNISLSIGLLNPTNRRRLTEIVDLAAEHNLPLSALRLALELCDPRDIGLKHLPAKTKAVLDYNLDCIEAGNLEIFIS